MLKKSLIVWINAKYIDGVSGLDANESNENLLKTFIFKDNIGTLRHKKCRLTLVNHNKKLVHAYAY